MVSLRQYLMTVTAAAILCGLVKRFFGDKGGSAVVVRLLTGIFFTLAVISPLAGISLEGWNRYAAALDMDGKNAVAAGEKMADDAVGAIIKSQAESYILDKAADLGAEVTVEVTLSDDSPPIPVAVRIGGNLSPYGKKQLERSVVEELGIAKENLKWTG